MNPHKIFLKAKHTNKNHGAPRGIPHHPGTGGGHFRWGPFLEKQTVFFFFFYCKQAKKTGGGGGDPPVFSFFFNI